MNNVAEFVGDLACERMSHFAEWLWELPEDLEIVLATDEQLERKSTGVPRLVRSAILLWAFAIIASALLGKLAIFENGYWKLLLYLTFLVLLASLPLVRDYWNRAHEAQKIFIGTMTFLLMLGQVASDSRGTFPFVEWNMYNKPAIKKDVLIMDYVGVTQSGRRLSLTPGKVFKSLGKGTLRAHNLLDFFAKGGLQKSTGDVQTEFLTRLDATLVSFRQRYNEEASVNDRECLTDIEVYLGEVDLPLPKSHGRTRRIAYSTATPGQAYDWKRERMQ